LARAGTNRIERALVEANWKLVDIFEKKIQSKLTEILGAGE
jgi:hypothetical protein